MTEVKAELVGQGGRPRGGSAEHGRQGGRPPLIQMRGGR